MKRSKTRFLFYFLNVFLVVIVLLGSLSIYKDVNYSPMVVIGSSMYPTLKEGDYGYAKKTSSAKKNIKRGQIILFHPNTDLNSIYIKRVIALPNDTFYLDSKTGDITVNGELFSQDFLEDGVKEKTCEGRKYYYADKDVTLGENEYFVLGDNRYISLDSAHGIGFVMQENIVSVLDVVLAKCDNARDYYHDDSSSLKVCSLNHRKYYSLKDWKYF